MKYLKIQNKGLLDVRLVALMGGTTKSKNDFKIGQFGTGLKYTLAYLYRNNIDFRIFVGTEEIKTSLVYEEIAGEIFEILCINDNRTSITTKMGEDWEAWMIVRELWCNALDEGEAVREETETFSPSEGATAFYIQIDSEIRKVLDNWSRYFIHDLKPISSSPTFDIYPGGKALRLYKNGVLIHENKETNSLFSYDIKKAKINELREYQGTVTYDIVQALAQAEPAAVTYFIENIREEQYEGRMDYNWYVAFGNQWSKTIGNAKLIHQKAVDIINSRGSALDLAGTIVVPEKVYSFLSQQFKGIGLLRTADSLNEFYEIHSEDLSLKVKQALTILEECGYFINPELTFIYGIFGDKNVLAQVNFDYKQIFVSEKMMDKGLFETVAMVIEENEHFKTGYSDHTREFQTHFINLFTHTLLEKHSVKL